MFPLTVGLLLALLGFILGSVVGLASEVTAGTALIRGFVVSLVLGVLGYLVSSLIGLIVPEFSKLSLVPSWSSKEKVSHRVDYVLPQEIPGDVLEALEKRLGEEEVQEESPAMSREGEREAEEAADITSDPQKMLAAMRAMIARDKT